MNESKTTISHAEARKIAKRFINLAWDNEGEKPSFSIPARPECDDDLRLMAYIEQQEKLHD